MRLDVYFHADEATNQKLDKILSVLGQVQQQEKKVALDLTTLTAEVTANTDAVASAASLLSTLADEVRATAGDPAAVAALADQLDANNQALSDAVAANTPAAP